MAKRALSCASSVFALVGVAMLAPAPAFAQSDDEGGAYAPIIVTAQRRAEAQVDVPITITSLSEETLATANVQELSDIAKVTPGLRFDFASGFFQPTIRGIGTAVTTSGGGGNVGIYIDGFYSPNPLAADFDLVSVESIQVLKGPQGTLFGRNTTGGAILVQTREPSTDGNAFQGQASYGRFSERDLKAYGNVAVSDRVAISVEGQYRAGNGWQHEINTDRDVGDFENWSTRISLKAELSDNVEVLLRYKHASTDDPSQNLTATFVDSELGIGAPLGGVPGTFTTKRREVASGAVPEFFKSNSDVVQGTIRVDLGFADFTSYSQYRSENVDSSIEVDYSGIETQFPGFGFQLGLPNENETWSQEFLLNSKPGTPLQWTAGLFYFQNSDTYVTDLPIPDNNNRIRFGGSGTVVKSYAAFVDATYEVTPQLFVTAGVRYAHDKIDDAYFNTRFLAPVLDLGNGDTFPAPNGIVYLRDFQPEAVEFAKDDRITPRFVIRYKPNEDMSVYASYTKGYKAAIIDVGGTCQNAPYVCNFVKPETIDAFEVGVKYDSRGLSAEFAGFYYDYKDLQISLFEAGTAQIVNAANSEIYGLEGQVNYQVTPAFNLNAGASWVHARYKNFDSAPIYTQCTFFDGTAPTGPCAGFGITYTIVPTDLKNVTMQRTPEFTGFLGARYETELAGGELALSGNLFYSSEFYFGPSGTQFKENGYETLSLRAQWTDPSENYYVALWGDNVTDSKYYTQAQYSNFGIGANWAKPVTYGIELGFKFGG
ncbi:MAG: TonB-dependent receptor [Novosphingobium sp.]|nr:TonB-dependent receptor [Novosphingobium sp.]MCP5402838.1 TonB-dependent receptor [Novosphingobium sp.]